VQFVGEEEPSALKQINDLRLTDLVSISAPVPHAQVAILQSNAHALLMLERRPTQKGYELLAGAKLFGYLKAGRPILGVVPEGEAARILREVGVSTIAHADSPDDICRALETLFNAWSTGRLSSLVPDSSACERYSVSSQTAALVRALEGVAPVEPFVPGVLEVVPSLRAELLLAKPA
jgi:hypothetical protein